MDPTCGLDPTLPGEPASGVELARLWAVEMGLRPGNTRSLIPSAVEPLVVKWAEARGWGPPPLRAIGLGLAAAGLQIWHAEGKRRLLLHRDDAARLRTLVWEAWAPRVPPGERPKQRPKRIPLQCALARLAYLERKEPTPGFHAQLAKDDAAARGKGTHARPVVDSRGRCYPSVAYAARALSAKRDREKAPNRLSHALQRDGHWKGMVWRYLTPEEVALVPVDAPCGVRVVEFSWQYSCQQRGLLTPGQSRKVLNQCSRAGAVRGEGQAG